MEGRNTDPATTLALDPRLYKRVGAAKQQTSV
jgi:hypothetical protein